MAERRGAYWCMVKVDFAAPELEADFNRWYNEVHVPELLALPGFIRAWRLEVSDEGPGLGEPGQTYIAVYEIDSPSVFEQRVAGRVAWDGKWGQYIQNWARTFYKAPYPAD